MDPIHFAIGGALGVVANVVVTGDWRLIACRINRHKMRQVGRIDFADRCNGIVLSCLCRAERESVARYCHEHEEELCHDRLWAAAPARYR